MKDQQMIVRCESRRKFLKQAASGAAAFYAGSSTIKRRIHAADKSTANPRKITAGAPQIFVDLEHVEKLDNVVQLFHTAQIHPENPVLVGEYEWERKMGGPTASFIHDQQEKRFKVWYQGVIGDRRGRVHTYGPHTLNYAVSQDGVHWEKPKLGIYPFTWKGQTTKANNIVVPQTYHNGKDHWESVLKDPTSPDPARRYKAIGWSSNSPDQNSKGWCAVPGHCGIWSMTSPDGLRWTHSKEPIFHNRPRPGTNDMGPVGDAQSLMIDTARNRYVAFLRGTGGDRLYSTSEDFIHWTKPAQSMPPVPGRAGNTLYNHLGFNYGDSTLGLVSHYAIRPDGVHNLTLRLLTSRDGLHYEFAGPEPHDRPPLIGVGQIGEWDRFMTLLTGAPPVRVGDELHIYYRGYSETHNRGSGKPNDTYYAGANGLATIRVDGFASLAAGFDNGQLTTKPIVFEQGSLRINAKANAHAQVAVEVLDERGQAIAGYTLAESVPCKQDNIEQPVRWKNRQDVSELAGRPVKLRFHLTNARLYSYTIG